MWTTAITPQLFVDYKDSIALFVFKWKGHDLMYVIEVNEHHILLHQRHDTVFPHGSMTSSYERHILFAQTS
jgi:hypothetical protein